jgi:hypothetical protein
MLPPNEWEIAISRLLRQAGLGRGSILPTRCHTGGDGDEVSVLGLLNLTAAFHRVDHQLLLQRLEHNFGVVGRPLEWF